MDVTPHFSEEFQTAIAASREHAVRLGNNFIAPEHILLGFLSAGEGAVYRRLEALTDVGSLSETIDRSIRGEHRQTPAPPPGHDIGGAVILTAEAEAVIHEAMASATSESIDAGHVLATMLRLDNSGRRVLNDAGITSENFTLGRG